MCNDLLTNLGQSVTESLLNVSRSMTPLSWTCQSAAPPLPWEWRMDAFQGIFPHRVWFKYQSPKFGQCVHDRWWYVVLIQLVNDANQNPSELGLMRARAYS